MRKMIAWLCGLSPDERIAEADVLPTYTGNDVAEALTGHMPLPGTDVEIVAYPISEQDLVLLVNKGGVCVFGMILAGALRNDLDVMQANIHMTDQRIELANRRSRCGRSSSRCWGRSST
jgi:hypothetical protein